MLFHPNKSPQKRNACSYTYDDDDVVARSLHRVFSRGAPVGAVPRRFSATIAMLFRRGDREASRGEFVEPCHRHGWRPAGLYRQGEKSVGRREHEKIGRRGGPIGRRRELFRPLLGAWMFVFSFLFFIVRFKRVFLRDVEVDTLDTPRHRIIRISTFFRRRRYTHMN